MGIKKYKFKKKVGVHYDLFIKSIFLLCEMTEPTTKPKTEEEEEQRHIVNNFIRKFR